MEKLSLKDCAKNWNIPIDEIEAELESSGLYPKRVTVATTIDEETAKKLQALLDTRRKGGAKAASERVGATKRNMGGSQMVTITQSRGENRSSHSVGGVGIRERLLARKAQAEAKGDTKTASERVGTTKRNMGGSQVVTITQSRGKSRPRPAVPVRLTERLLASERAQKSREILLELARKECLLASERTETSRKRKAATSSHAEKAKREKKAYKTRKQAEAAKVVTELYANRKLWVYQCKDTMKWHLTSSCPDCHHREVFQNEDLAKKAKVTAYKQPPSCIEMHACPKSKCGYIILCHQNTIFS